MKFAPGDKVEITQGGFPLTAWETPSLIGRATTVIVRDMQQPKYYHVECSHMMIHENALRLLPRDDSRDATTWDKCVWQPREVRI